MGYGLQVPGLEEGKYMVFSGAVSNLGDCNTGIEEANRMRRDQLIEGI